MKKLNSKTYHSVSILGKLYDISKNLLSNLGNQSITLNSQIKEKIIVRNNINNIQYTEKNLENNDRIDSESSIEKNVLRSHKVPDDGHSKTMTIAIRSSRRCSSNTHEDNNENCNETIDNNNYDDDSNDYDMSYHVMSCHVISCHVISCHIISYHVISCHVMSYHVISCHIMSCHVMSMSYHVISCHIMSYHVISYHFMTIISFAHLQAFLPLFMSFFVSMYMSALPPSHSFILSSASLPHFLSSHSHSLSILIHLFLSSYPILFSSSLS